MNKFDRFGNQIEKQSTISSGNKQEINEKVNAILMPFVSEMKTYVANLTNEYLKQQLNIVKNYVNFNNRRLVGISAGLDEKDAVNKKQMEQSIKDAVNKKQAEPPK